MDIWMVLKIFSALATAATGLLAFLKPSATYGFIGLNAEILKDGPQYIGLGENRILNQRGLNIPLRAFL